MSSTMNQDIDLDSVYKGIGQAGRYQLFTMFLLILPGIFSVFPTYEYIFTARDIAYRCHIPECEGNASLSSYEADWVELAIPKGDKCTRYAPIASSSTADSCSNASFDRNRTIACDEYIYGETNSMVYEFNMPCQEWKSSLIGTISNLAYFIILPITGILSDKFGRKIVLIVNAINTALILIVRAYSVSYEMYLAVTFIGGIIGAGAFTTCYLMACELFAKEYRAIGGVSITTSFALGHCIIGLVAWVLPDWRTIEKVLAYPQILTFLYFLILPESIRWLITKGKLDRAEQALKKAASVNKSESSNILIEKFMATLTARSDSLCEVENKSQKSVLRRIMASRTMIKRILITPVLWFIILFVYYGATINSVRIAGNIYMNFVMVTLIEIPGYVVGLYGMNRIGRKWSLLIGLAVSCAANFMWPFLPIEYPWIHLVMMLLGKMFISLAVAVVYTYTVELYPTEIRHSGMAMSSMFARVGAICAPQTPLLANIWAPLPNLIFALCSLIACLSVFVMPETLGKTLPDTVEDADKAEST